MPSARLAPLLAHVSGQGRAAQSVLVSVAALAPPLANASGEAKDPQLVLVSAHVTACLWLAEALLGVQSEFELVPLWDVRTVLVWEHVSGSPLGALLPLPLVC